jgi:elongator complex protein 3
MDPVGLLLDQISETLPENRAQLRKLKTRIASQAKMPLIRNDALLDRYRLDVASGLRHPNERLERLLTLNGIRSQSGIATVTVITEPYACPGRCVYCPTEARAPKSYLTNEPAVMRALRNDYDPYRQMQSRLEALEETGHATDKIELIVKGGTWSFYPHGYQQEFIQRCVEAANDFARRARLGAPGKNGHPPRASSLEPPALVEAQRVNETAKNRIIGVTIETRPDYVNEAEIRRLRELGVTRVELGVQTLEESVLGLIVRDHGTAEVRQATQLLKDAGFKVAYHLMPNLPGATPESDLESARKLFEDPGYRPDAMKLYPCVVIETAELYQWWKAGRYTPYDDETLVELLIHIKQLVPPYVRIERVIRDIPSTSIRAGCLVTNLREEVHRRMRARGLRCRCIRCRQVREASVGAFTLIRRTYEASDGIELFLSFEDLLNDRLASLLRLRIPACAATRSGVVGRPSPRSRNRLADWIPALKDAGLIRELHSYGQHLPIHQHSEQAIQHRGLGQRLMEEAEQIVREEFGLRRIAVIAGVGVREYYRRFGYELEDTYMVKPLA